MSEQLNTMDNIVKISRKLNLSHIGSNLNAYPVLKEIYDKKPFRVVMSNAHSHLAHLVVKEELNLLPSNDSWSYTAEELIKHDIHCNRQAFCDASGGSLGHGGIAIGMALAHPDKQIYLTESDGSMQEGSSWEVLRLARDLKIDNLHIYFCLNGYTAVAEIDRIRLGSRIKKFFPRAEIRHTYNGDDFDSLEGHYAKL